MKEHTYITQWSGSIQVKLTNKSGNEVILNAKDLRVVEHRQESTEPAKVLWCSAEPLLDNLNFIYLLDGDDNHTSCMLDWLVVGGESGPGRRDCGVESIVRLASQAKACGCKVFVKQDCAPTPGQQGRIPDSAWALKEFPV